MHCPEFQQTFQAVLDDRRNPEDQSSLREHADVCASCRSDLVAWELLSGGLDSWDPLESKQSFESIVAAALSETPTATTSAKTVAAPSRFDFSTIVAPILLSAAILAIAAFVPTMLTNQGDQPSVKPSAVADQQPAEPQPITIVADDELIPPDSPGDQLTPAEGRELLVEMHSRLPLAPTLESFSSDLSRTPLPTGLRPIAGSFEVAFKTFRNAIPGSNNDSPLPLKPQASNMHPPILG